LVKLEKSTETLGDEEPQVGGEEKESFVRAFENLTKG
jgi:hypothetical protein